MFPIIYIQHELVVSVPMPPRDTRYQYHAVIQTVKQRYTLQIHQGHSAMQYESQSTPGQTICMPAHQTVCNKKSKEE